MADSRHDGPAARVVADVFGIFVSAREEVGVSYCIERWSVNVYSRRSLISSRTMPRGIVLPVLLEMLDILITVVLRVQHSYDNHLRSIRNERIPQSIRAQRRRRENPEKENQYRKHHAAQYRSGLYLLAPDGGRRG